MSWRESCYMEVKGDTDYLKKCVPSKQSVTSRADTDCHHTRSVVHLNASLSANIRQHKYSVKFKGKKLPKYLNICQTHAHLMIQEQMSASSVCCKLDSPSDTDISNVFSCYPQTTTTFPYLSHCEHSRNQNKASDNKAQSTHMHDRAHPQRPHLILVHPISSCKSRHCWRDLDLCLLLRQRA